MNSILRITDVKNVFSVLVMMHQFHIRSIYWIKCLEQFWDTNFEREWYHLNALFQWLETTQEFKVQSKSDAL